MIISSITMSIRCAYVNSANFFSFKASSISSALRRRSHTYLLLFLFFSGLHNEICFMREEISIFVQQTQSRFHGGFSATGIMRRAKIFLKCLSAYYLGAVVLYLDIELRLNWLGGWKEFFIVSIGNQFDLWRVIHSAFNLLAFHLRQLLLFLTWKSA